jgi:hypothetical protein
MAMAKRTVGVQLIIFGKRPGQDLAGVLNDVAAAGYQAVETGMMASQVSGKDFKKMLSDRGMVHVGVHTGGEKADQTAPIQEWLHQTGGTDIIFSDLETRQLTEDMYKRKADAYNAAGEQIRKAGLTLSYHNHAWEFGQVGGKQAIEWLYEHTNPDLVKACIDATAKTVAAETKRPVKYQVGTMIELPRAALKADEIAETAEFFSFGTNDLTQTAFGISRDDAASFLGIYTSKGILPADPFVSIDREGVGELVRIATERGRKARPNIKLGICGEHGGDPASVAFCHEIKLDYVSCSPFRVPIARLAAAQAALGKPVSSTA